MLKFLIKNNDLTVTELNKPFSCSISMNEDIPADALSVSFLGRLNIPEACYIQVYDDESLVFSGIIDEIRFFADDTSCYTKLTARSMAAVLLDNEAKPVSYNEVSTSVVFRNHLEPYGIKGYTGDEKTVFGKLNISKGMTNWQIFSYFCVRAFNKKPRIEADGTASFCGLTDKGTVRFSNTDGIKYNSVKENKKLCSEITQVRVKFESGADYDRKIRNAETEEKPVKRERFIDATNPSVPDTLADSIISNSYRDSYVVTLRCEGRLLGILGAGAEVFDEFIGEKKNMYVSDVSYSLSSSGEYTTVTLKRRDKNVDT
ncbi:MAG: hypothetical protein IIU14_05160 [Ruminococcus sp.]|nr:hypothetical protein [Ruminococcus sp.]